MLGWDFTLLRVQTGSLLLMSLLDMLRCFVQRYLNIGYVIGSESGTAVLGMPPLNTGPLLEEQKERLLEFLHTNLLPETQNAELRATKGLVESLINDLNYTPPFEQERITEKLRTVRVVLQNELKERYCLFISEDKAELWVAPERFFPLSFAAFPSAQNNMRDACRSDAMNLGGACVHHCMGVLQCGLYALANHLGVSFPASIELENWKNIIDRIEKEIRKLEQQPKSQNKDASLQFLSEAALQFRYFKDAWRNHVEHHRATYDDYQAHGILTHVRDFMERLAAGGLRDQQEVRMGH